MSDKSAKDYHMCTTYDFNNGRYCRICSAHTTASLMAIHDQMNNVNVYSNMDKYLDNKLLCRYTTEFLDADEKVNKKTYRNRKRVLTHVGTGGLLEWGPKGGRYIDKNKYEYVYI